MSELIEIYRRVEKVMCSRCNTVTRIRCTTAPRGGSHKKQMCICIENILVPDDEYYPTKLLGE